MTRYSYRDSIDTLLLKDLKEGSKGTTPSRYSENSAYLRERVSAISNSTYGSLGPHQGWAHPSANSARLVYNRSYEKLVESLKGETSQLGSSIGEWRSSLDMIASRAIQLRSAIQAFRKGNITRTARILSVPKSAVRKASGRVSKTHYASSLWLETYFGWLPLIGDIYNSIDVLQSPVRNPEKISSGSSISYDANYRQTVDGKPVNFLVGMGARYGVRHYAKVRISNQNLFLANRLGLINPAAIGWELVPFSFVVDWFSNVGQILESITDFVGVEILSSGYSTMLVANGTIAEYWPPGNKVTEIKGFSQLHYQRVPGSFPSPSIAFRPPFSGWKRAATQISLLNQLFIKPR